MLSENLIDSTPSTFLDMLAKVDDEGLLYSYLEADRISLPALRYERDHGLDAKEKKAIIARLCEFSLTRESSLPKIEKVLATINKDKKDFEPGQPTSDTPRRQVLSFWHEQAKATAAPKWLIEAWNAYYNENVESDEFCEGENSNFALVVNYEDRVQNFSVEALCQGIFSDDDTLKAKCLAVWSDRVMKNSGPELALFANRRSTLRASKVDEKQLVKTSSKKGANIIDFIKEQPLLDSKSIYDRRQLFTQLFSLEEKCRTAEAVKEKLRKGVTKVDLSLASTIFLLLHGVEEPNLEQDIPKANILLAKMENSDDPVIRIYAEYLEAYALEHVYPEHDLNATFEHYQKIAFGYTSNEHVYPERDLNAAFERYEKIAYEYTSNGDETISALIKASQARLAALAKCENAPNDLTGVKVHLAACLPDRAKLQYQNFNVSRSQQTIALIEQAKLFAPNNPEMILLSAMLKERLGMFKKAFVEYLEITENKVFDLDIRWFACAAYMNLSQEHGYRVTKFDSDSTGDRFSYLIPFCQFTAKKRNCIKTSVDGVKLDASYFNEHRTVLVSKDGLNFLTWRHKRSLIKMTHQELLGRGANFANLKRWSELCATMFVFGGSGMQPGRGYPSTWKGWEVFPNSDLKSWNGRGERQFWQKCWSETFVRMHSIASADNDDKSRVVSAWNKICAEVHCLSKAGVWWNDIFRAVYGDGSNVLIYSIWYPIRDQMKANPGCGIEHWNAVSQEVSRFLTTHPVFQYSLARLFENKPKNSIHFIDRSSPFFLQSKPLDKAKKVYQQLAKENEPMALEHLADILKNNNEEHQGFEHLTRAYLLVNPDCKSPAKFIIKPSMKNLASDATSAAEKKRLANIADSSPEAREVYAVHLAEKMGKWHSGIANNSEQKAQKMYVEFLSIFANKRYPVGAEFHQELASNLDGTNAAILFKKVVAQLCTFITSNDDLITTEHVNDLRSIWQKLEPAVNSIDSRQRKGIAAEGESLWTVTTEKLYAAPSLSAQNELQSPANSADFLLDSKQDSKDILPEAEQLSETNPAHVVNYWPRVIKVDRTAIAPEEEPPAVELLPETNRSYLGEPVPQTSEGSSLPAHGNSVEHDKKAKEGAVVIHQPAASDQTLGITTSKKAPSTTSALVTPHLKATMAASNTPLDATPRVKTDKKAKLKEKSISNSHPKEEAPEAQELPSATTNSIKPSRRVVQFA